MEVKAKLRHCRIAPRKVRLVAGVVRSLGVNNAANQLNNLDKKSAPVVLKLLNSAIANATNNFSLKKDDLYIKEIKVDSGPALKRFMPRAHGRGARILKFTSHITIVLDEKKSSKEDKKEVKKEKEVKSEKKEKTTKKEKITKNSKSLKKVGDK